MSGRKGVALLGATGSIGESTLSVIRANQDRLRLVGAAAGQNRKRLDAIAREFELEHTALFAESGLDGLKQIATLPEADIVVVAVVGTAGLFPTLAAIDAGKTIALASKEILVMAGRFVTQAAERAGVSILPVDSEHNAIFQCLQGCRGTHEVKRLILTASGGPFRDCTLQEMESVTPEQAMAHPNWDMGPKITIDSATMANKGLEMIEARWLFGMRPGQVDVVVHPQSIVHSMVEYVDGSILSQMSPPSMTFAIQHCLLYPDRAPGVARSLDFSHNMRLDFRPPDSERFPCLRLAREAMERDGVAPAVFNAANEVAVEAFVRESLPFLAIPKVIEHTLEGFEHFQPPSIESICEADAEARRQASRHLRQYL